MASFKASTALLAVLVLLYASLANGTAGTLAPRGHSFFFLQRV